MDPSTTAGTFIGHAMPGYFLHALGTWWAFGAWRAYILSRLGRRRDFVCTASFPLPNFNEKLCLEGLAKVLCVSLLAAGQIIKGNENGVFTTMGYAQHTSVYVFYVLSGLADLLTTHKVPVPKGTDYAMLLMALAVEGFVFHFHVHGRSPLDALVHSLLVCTAVCEAVCVAIEMTRKRSVLATLGRAFFGVVQGTWCFQIGFILYNPLQGAKEWEEDHQGLMLVTAIYTLHMAGALVYLGVVGVLAWLWCTSCEADGEAQDVAHDLPSKNRSMVASRGMNEAKVGETIESDHDLST